MTEMEWEQELYEQIAPHIRLENTRLLAKGVQELRQQYERGEEANWELKRLIAFVEDAYEKSWGEKGYLAQNPNTELFRFRNHLLPAGKKPEPSRDECIRLASMLLMDHTLNQMERLGRDREDLSSLYETLCGCLRDILGFNMCYIAYQYLDETRVLAASAVYRQDLHDTLSEKAMAEVLDDFQRLQSDGTSMEQVAGNIFLAEGRDLKSLKLDGQLLFIPLKLSVQDQSPGERLHLVFHLSGAKKKTELRGLLSQLRDALFLRGHLVNMLSRDFRHLMNIHREYRGITQKSEGAGAVRILHVSDLHVQQDNCQEIIDCIQKLDTKEIKPVDFIAITGDVAQGRCSAGDLEANYDCAAKVIRELAFQIWQRESVHRDTGTACVLGQDWKKRVLIIPGNHDYASMNELETQHDETHRASAGGRPAAKEGSPMAKFTYYINFLRQLLDVDIGTLIDNGLNEFRRYDDLGVSFLSLNTSIMANPLRNNKVHLDEDFVAAVEFKLQHSIQAGNRVVCLCHHGPRYEIDYLSDQYYEAYVCTELTHAFRKCLPVRVDGDDMGKKVDIEKAREEMKAVWETVEHAEDDPLKNESIQIWLQKNNAKRIPENIKEQIVKGRKKSRLYADYQIFAGPDRKASLLEIDERYQNIRYAVEKADHLSKKDKDAYQAVFDKLRGGVRKRLTVILSGHTHRRDDVSLPDGTPQYVADRFFSKRFDYEDGCTEKKTAALKQYSVLKYSVCELSDKKVIYKSKEAQFEVGKA